MADYTIINGTSDQLVDVNIGGDDVDALSHKDAVTLTDTELGTLLVTAGVAVMKSAASQVQKRVVGVVAQYVSG